MLSLCSLQAAKQRSADNGQQGRLKREGEGASRQERSRIRKVGEFAGEFQFDRFERLCEASSALFDWGEFELGVGLAVELDFRALVAVPVDLGIRFVENQKIALVSVEGCDPHGGFPCGPR